MFKKRSTANGLAMTGPRDTGAAVKEITNAIHALQPGGHKGHANAHVAKKGNRPVGNKEPQQQSESQLQQAVASLNLVQKELAGLPGARPVKASAAVTQAIKEL